jgi:hypothetical protein
MARAQRDEPAQLAIGSEQPIITSEPAPMADLATMNGGNGGSAPDEVPANG